MISGGEPTVHPQIVAILDALVAAADHPHPRQHERHPARER